jgi:hypothetical protein
MPEKNRPKHIFLVCARGISNPAIFNLIQVSLSERIKFLKFPKFISSQFETTFNIFVSRLSFFNSILVEPERQLMWVNYDNKYRRSDPEWTLRSAIGNYFSNTSVFDPKSSNVTLASELPRNSLKLKGFKSTGDSLNNIPLTIGLIDRDGAFRGGNPLRDTFSSELSDLSKALRNLNYKIIRLGSKRNFKVPEDYVDLDFPFSEYAQRFDKELAIIKSLDACISWKTGYQEVPLLFRIPTVMLDEFWRNDKTQTVNVPPTYFHKQEKRTLLLPEVLIRFGLAFEDEIYLREVIARMPAEPKVIVGALDQLLSNSQLKDSQITILVKKYEESLRIAISHFNGKELKNNNFLTYNLNRLLSDLVLHPQPISFKFIETFQSEIEEVSKFVRNVS